MHHLNRVTGLARLLTPAILSASASIGPEGGTIAIPEAGLSVEFPEGALTEQHSVFLSADSSLVGFHLSASPPLPTTLARRAIIRQALDEQHPREGLVFAKVDTITTEAAAVGFFRAHLHEGGVAVTHVWGFSGYLLASGFNAGQPCDPTVVTDGSCVWVDDGDSGEAPR
jgi:hypothetical protein